MSIEEEPEIKEKLYVEMYKVSLFEGKPTEELDAHGVVIVRTHHIAVHNKYNKLLWRNAVKTFDQVPWERVKKVLMGSLKENFNAIKEYEKTKEVIVLGEFKNGKMVKNS